MRNVQGRGSGPRRRGAEAPRRSFRPEARGARPCSAPRRASANPEGNAGQNLGRDRQPKPPWCHQRRRGRGGIGGNRRPSSGPGLPREAAARGGCVVLLHLLRAESQLLQPQPLVVRRHMPAPQHQVARCAAHRLAVEQQLHLVLALLSGVSLRRQTPAREPAVTWPARSWA